MSHPGFSAAADIIRSRLYEAGRGDSITPIACRIHHDFGSLDGKKHNCLGCNFADATNGIYHSLCKTAAFPSELEFDFADFILWLYLFVERANILFDIISLPAAYRFQHFDVFISIKRWANFLKHPNYFILVHHPDYFVEGDNRFDPARYSAVIDTGFVRENYNAEAKSRQGAIRAKLQNKKDIAVVFPQPEMLAAAFCDCYELFCDLTRNNAVYKEVLSDISTFDNYYADGPEKNDS